MAQNSQVPKFGNWEGEENYTDYFEKARKGRKMSNPNDPKQNSELVSDDASPIMATPLRISVEPEKPVEPRAAKPKHERRSSRDDRELRQVSHENLGRKADIDSSEQQTGEVGASPGDKKGSRTSGSFDRNVERSPLHPHHQAKAGGRGGGSGTGSSRSSPSWERKPSEGSQAPSTPGRSRLRTFTRGDETPDTSAPVPKFGDWDESDPAAADGFTGIFEKVREEKEGGGARVPSMPNDSSYSNGRRQANADNSTMWGCLSWCRK